MEIKVMINRQELVPQYAKEYVKMDLKGYTFFSTELVQGLSPEDAFKVLELFQIEINRLLRENREHGTTSDHPQRKP